MVPTQVFFCECCEFQEQLFLYNTSGGCFYVYSKGKKRKAWNKGARKNFSNELFFNGKIFQWFISSKLSLNVNQTKYSFFRKPNKRDDIPLLLPKLNTNNSEIERLEYLKFLGVLLDDNLCWKEHIKYIESKIAKNIGLLYKAKPYIDKRFFHCIILTYIHK